MIPLSMYLFYATPYITSALILSFSSLYRFFFLALHDALPIYRRAGHRADQRLHHPAHRSPDPRLVVRPRSEEHTSELQSPCNLVCRLLLEKKKRHKSKDVHFSVPYALTTH